MIRYEFVDALISDENIHPVDIFDRERELAQEFIEKNSINGKANNFLFKRYNIPYTFDENKNLKAAVELHAGVLEKYFRDSELSKLRASHDYQEKVKELRGHIWKMNIDWIEGRCFRYLPNTNDLKVLDVGSRMAGWVEQLKQAKHLSNVATFESLPPIMESENLENDYNVVIGFNVLQRQTDPKDFFNKIKEKLSNNGIGVLSFRLGTGFDVLTLKEKNKSLFPLDHLFLPSLDGIKKALYETGLELLEFTTPGQLDAEIVKKAVERGDCTDAFITHLVETVRTDELQTFIQKNNLSSYARLVIKKK